MLVPRLPSCCGNHSFWKGSWTWGFCSMPPWWDSVPVGGTWGDLEQSWIRWGFRWSSRWWFQTFFMFTPIWGRWTHFDEHIFQMGWNHQLVLALLFKVILYGFDLPCDASPVPTKSQLSNFLGTPGEDYFKGNPKSLNFYFLVIWWDKSPSNHHFGRICLEHFFQASWPSKSKWCFPWCL